MFASLQPLLYVQITPERVIIRNLRTHTTLSEVAEIALAQQGGKPHVLAVDADNGVRSCLLPLLS